MASFSGTISAPDAREALPSATIRSIVRGWIAELAPFPNRWRRAARVAFVTAIGAGVMAAMQISNPLGLTMLVGFAAPEFAFSLATGVIFLISAAAIQIVMLTVVGALADNAVMHVCAFIAFTAVSTYLIYGVPGFGRLWLWIQIPALTAFYMVLFEHRTVGWDSAQMFAGTAIAITLLWLFNNVIWPESAASVLTRSLRSTLERSRHRLDLLIAIYVGDAGADDDHAVASKLAYHLALLNPAIRQAKNIREAARLLASVMIAERIDSAIGRLCVAACTQAGVLRSDDVKRALIEATDALGDAVEHYIAGIDETGDIAQSALTNSLTIFHQRIAALEKSHAEPSSGDVAQHLVTIARLLTVDPRELPSESDAAAADFSPHRPFRLNKFLVRFCVRHTVAMSLAFIAGLFDNSAALHAALWLLMIGGPPSHGATAKKFTMRAIGASGALIFAALATIILAPNFTTLPPYLAAIFVGVLLMTYVGEGGGALSYLSIGATAFVIAFSGPGPRPDMLGSIWTIWGISLGMIIRAIISAVSIERPNRTLAEEIERPLRALVELVPRAEQPPGEIAVAQKDVIAGIQEMLTVAADARLEGRPIGIDAANLVDALDTIRRLAFVLGSLAHRNIDPSSRMNDSARATLDDFDDAMRTQLDGWLRRIRAQLEPGQLTPAPLRTAVNETPSPDFSESIRRMRASGADLAAREHAAALLDTLERQLTIVSTFDQRGDGDGMPRATD